MNLPRFSILVLALAAGAAFAAEPAAAPDAAGQQATPQAVFNAFKVAILARNREAVRNLVVADEEDLQKNLEHAANMKDDERARVESATLADFKAEGDYGIGIVKVVREEKARYDDQYFLRQDGQWRLYMKRKPALPQPAVTALREWYLARKNALMAENK